MTSSEPLNKGIFMNLEKDSTTTLPAKPIETIYTSSQIVACEGNHTLFGHPRVFLKLKNGQATCPYCSKSFVYKLSESN